MASFYSCERIRCLRFVAHTTIRFTEVRVDKLANTVFTQPYLDSDMQSRWYDFGGDTIVRTDSYGPHIFTFSGQLINMVQLHPPYLRPPVANRMDVLSRTPDGDQLGNRSRV